MNLWWVVLQNQRIWFWTQTHNEDLTTSKFFNCLLPSIQRRRRVSFASIIRYSQSNPYHKGGEFLFSSIIRYSQSNFYHYHSLSHHRYMNETLMNHEWTFKHYTLSLLTISTSKQRSDILWCNIGWDKYWWWWCFNVIIVIIIIILAQMKEFIVKRKGKKKNSQQRGVPSITYSSHPIN
jgi:hypothetical protein